MAEPDKKPNDKKSGNKKPAPAPSTPGFPLAEIVVGIIVLLAGVSFAGMLFAPSAANGLVNFLGSLRSFLKVAATLISMAAVVVILYSFMRLRELGAEESRKLGLALNWNVERSQKNKRWERVEEYMSSLNSSDWKIAILEADNILDEVIERMGYKGETLGERMKNIEASDFPYLEEAWTAHKTRNAIAHKGTDYEISRSEAEQAINIYHRIFKELGYL